MESYEKIAKILRTDKNILRVVEEKMFEITGRKEIVEQIVSENELRIKASLESLNQPTESAHDIYLALIEKMRKDDADLAELIRRQPLGGESDFESMMKLAKEASGVGQGKFLKFSKAREMILNNPPLKILEFLGYKDINELLEKEDIHDIFAGLRFVEDGEWLNEVFFKPYENLISDDFETREIGVRVLGEKWVKAAEKFLKKKYHNLSHLKELGFVFIIPIAIESPGSTIRNFGLVLHYLHEIKFYSDLFIKYSQKENFAQNFTASLRGDVLNIRPPDTELGKIWFIIQRYLAKDDEYDWRLFYPHVNPEAIHWAKAENDLCKLSDKYGLNFDFWRDLGPVGDFFKDESGVDVLVSFNFLDTAMSLFQEKEMVKYLYHHQEALWNRIFSGFLGESLLEKMIMEDFDKGIIKL